MSDVLTLHVFEADLPPHRARTLLDWCAARGADAFSVSVVGSPSDVEAFGQALEAQLAPFRIPASAIPRLAEGEPGSYWTRPTDLWRLTAESAEVLWQALGGRFLSYYPAGQAWCEDPVLYRGADLMLGVVSHEAEGVLRIQSEEQALLDEAGIPYRLEGEWVGY